MKSLWKARVDCWRETDGKQMFETRHFLFEATDSTEAFAFAAKHAEETAGNKQWLAFEVRSVATVILPLELTGRDG